VKKLALVFIAVCMLLSLAACSSKCKNGCGNAADPDCYADMCDDCCDYFCGLNGCKADH